MIWKIPPSFYENDAENLMKGEPALRMVMTSVVYAVGYVGVSRCCRLSSACRHDPVVKKSLLIRKFPE